MNDAELILIAAFVVTPAIAMLFTYFYVIRRPTVRRSDKLD